MPTDWLLVHMHGNAGMQWLGEYGQRTPIDSRHISSDHVLLVGLHMTCNIYLQQGRMQLCSACIQGR